MMLVIESLGKDPKDFLDFLVIPEVVHNGTLIIDDIEDGSLLRRNKPCIHRIYGEDIAVNAGNSMYYIPLLPLIKNRRKIPPQLLLDIYEIYIQEMINISHGQAMDIFWHRGKKSDVTVDQYLQMCGYKTGTLARMSAKIGAKLAGANDKLVNAFGKFAESIAIAFQIQDDVLNLHEKLGKETGEDIKEGKRSLLVIRALSKLAKKDAQQLIHILNLHTNDRNLIKEAISLIRSTDAFDFANRISKNMINKSWKELNIKLPDSKAKHELKMLADYLIERGR
jgi:geranylgeranyl pyrophosphate synthase